LIKEILILIADYRIYGTQSSQNINEVQWKSISNINFTNENDISTAELEWSIYDNLYFYIDYWTNKDRGVVYPKIGILVNSHEIFQIIKK